MPAPRAPSGGTPKRPYISTHASGTSTATARIEKYMLGRVSERPSLKFLHAKKIASGNAPHAIARRNASASSRIAGTTENASSSAGAPWCSPRNSSRPSASAIHSACRNTPPVSARRPAPSSCATAGVTASISPITISSASTHTW